MIFSETVLPTAQCLTVMQIVPRLNMGGVERGTVEFAAYLQQQGHRSIVVSNGGSLVEQLDDAGVEHIELEVAAKSLKTLKTIAKLRALIEKFQVDVVHARSRIPAWLCLAAFRKLSSKPLFITTLHGLHSVNRYSSVMARGDRVIAVSDVAKDYLNTHFKKYLKHEPVVIHRGVDPQFHNKHLINKQWLAQIISSHPEFNQVRKVLLPGRLTAIKGLEHVIPWLKQADNQCRLVLTAEPGQSSYSKKMADKFEQLGLADQVIWLGNVSSMPDLYASVDLVLSTNNKPESFGRTVLEALTMGKPVVAFNLGGVGEIMQQLFPAGLVDAGDVLSLTEKMNQFLMKPPEVNIQHSYQNEVMFEKILSLYHEALAVQQ